MGRTGEGRPWVAGAYVLLYVVSVLFLHHQPDGNFLGAMIGALLVAAVLLAGAWILSLLGGAKDPAVFAGAIFMAFVVLGAMFDSPESGSSPSADAGSGALTFDATNYVTEDEYEDFTVKIRLWYDGQTGGVSDEGTMFPMDSGTARYVDWSLDCDASRATDPAIEIRVQSSQTNAEEAETWGIAGCGMGFDLGIHDGGFSAYDIELE